MNLNKKIAIALIVLAMILAAKQVDARSKGSGRSYQSVELLKDFC